MAMYVAFLRGINITGRRVKQQELRSCFDALGFPDIQAFGASGNIRLAAGDGPLDEIAMRIEQGLRGRFGYQVAVFLRTANEVRAIAAHQPFAAEQLAASLGQIHVALLATRPTRRMCEDVLALATSDDALAFADQELYWLPRADARDSMLDRAAIARLVGPMTFRTKKTIEKIAREYFAT